MSSRDPTLIDDLRRIVEPATLGCPVRPFLWVKSHDKLAVASVDTKKKELIGNYRA